jgi:monothiol glutaredoxin
MALSEALRTKLSELVTSKRVVVFMKGNRHFPQCGFSAQVVGILNELIPSYETVNVLADPQIREGIKEFSSWPTIPQLYVDGQFVGGCDIVKEMHASGELMKLLGVEAPKVKVPAIALSDAAAAAFKEAAKEGAADEKLRLEVGPNFQYELYFGPPSPNDIRVMANGVEVLLDRESARRADGISIDYIDTPDGGAKAFKIDNPNEPARVKPLSPKELKTMLDEGEPLELFDVRPETERQRAKLEAAKPLDAEGEAYLMGLDRTRKLVFHCHHGMRSRAAAERFVREGFKNVYNLEGGIDAWSQAVDPNVPRYR